MSIPTQPQIYRFPMDPYINPEDLVVNVNNSYPEPIHILVQQECDDKLIETYYLYWGAEVHMIKRAGVGEDYKHHYKDLMPHRLGGPAVIRDDGTEEWWVNGKLHRVGAPAIVSEYGADKWYRNGLLHRLGGPAVSDKTRGIEEWYQFGKLHRVGAPAIVYDNGHSREWYINGKLHRDDGPAYEMIASDGGVMQSWYQYGKLHRTDGPARIDPDGLERWYSNDSLHRINGPAITGSYQNYYVMGTRYFNEEDFKEALYQLSKDKHRETLNNSNKRPVNF